EYIMNRTPQIPDDCQWAIFLRCHDELTLEMVTDEDRLFMRENYAPDHRARINLGIRRRLAPLLDNDQRRIKLMNVMLFSMPGTPLIYYGDEIGMGDNIWLDDRDGVRTPMQWNAEKNAGFSEADADKLYLPVIVDPEYNYTKVNVEASEENEDSLLNWMRQIIDIRKQYKVFGRGSFTFANANHPSILSYWREYEAEKVLVVINLSAVDQSVSIDLVKEDYEHQLADLLSTDKLFAQDGFAKLWLKPYEFKWMKEVEPDGLELAMKELKMEIELG
ncbi:MAG: alpha-glucosidase C-terminal domain-containing protein, partial [Saprospiraceae bacterium]